MNVRFRPICWVVVCIAVVIALVYCVWLADQRYRAACDQRYELDAIAYVKSHLGNLRPGMSWPTARETVFGGVRGNPRLGYPLKHFVDNDFGVRRDIVRLPDKRFIVLEYGPNYAAPLDRYGAPKDRAGWQLLRFGYADQPYLR